MQDARKAEADRRNQDRRISLKDIRQDTEKGVAGERRSGQERRDDDDRRRAMNSKPAQSFY